MIEVISPYATRGIAARHLESLAPATLDNSNFGHPTDQLDFQAMVEADGFEDSSNMSSPTVGSNGFLQLAQNVDQSKANMQSALLQASVTNQPEVIQRAAAALSRYDLQTLFLSKVANKAFQAVDRLTNLQ